MSDLALTAKPETPSTPAGGAVAWIAADEIESGGAYMSAFRDDQPGLDCLPVYTQPPATVSVEAVLALVPKLTQLADDIARVHATLNYSALAIRDELESLTRGEK